MKWLEVKVHFRFKERDLATDLIANIFYDLGIQGVVIEDEDTSLRGDRWAGTLQVSECDSVTGFFPIGDNIVEQCKAFEKRLKSLDKEIKIEYRISYREIDEEDWAESWKEFFWPVKIGKRMAVKPTWREYEPQPMEIVIEIDPGMAFGTGTHPTTCMCMELIERHLKKGESFLDIGTGSGILLITAAKLGAKRVLGVDIDEVAVNTAQKNLNLNRIDSEIASVRTGNLVKGIEYTYDIVVANIVSEVILALLSHIDRVLKNRGLFICSGIFEDNKYAVIDKMHETGFEITDIILKEGWVAITGRLRKGNL